jgi:hypothetical protein
MSSYRNWKEEVVLRGISSSLISELSEKQLGSLLLITVEILSLKRID